MKVANTLTLASITGILSKESRLVYTATLAQLGTGHELILPIRRDI